jgi:hypothetical protein
LKYGELTFVDLVEEESGGVNFCAFEHDKRPNGLDE